MPAVEATFTMFPRVARRCGRAAFTVLNGPVRLTARTRAHSASSISSRRALRPTPAAFTSTCRPPNTDAARSTESRTDAMSVTSQRPPSAVPPARRMARIVSASPSGFTSTANTFAPSAANSLAVARARPDPAPVMNRTRSVKRPVDKLPFPLLSDPERKVMKTYGAYGEKMMYGKKTVGVIRSTVWIGPDGKVRKHWARVSDAAKHPEQVLVALRGE